RGRPALLPFEHECGAGPRDPGPARPAARRARHSPDDSSGVEAASASIEGPDVRVRVIPVLRPTGAAPAPVRETALRPPPPGAFRTVSPGCAGRAAGRAA